MINLPINCYKFLTIILWRRFNFDYFRYFAFWRKFGTKWHTGYYAYQPHLFHARDSSAHQEQTICFSNSRTNRTC